MSGLVRRVSLTGPDDATDIQSLAALSARFPTVEWAILYFPEREGIARNPSQAWRQAFFTTPMSGFKAVHLCGKEAFVQLLAGRLPAEVLKADRFQLNINARFEGFTPDEVQAVFHAAAKLPQDIILQLHSGSEAGIRLFMESVPTEAKSRVHILVDGSKGRGELPDSWGRPAGLAPALWGYAGGINPTNVDSVLKSVSKLGEACWIDMETGVRTGNQFDVLKAEAVLQATTEFNRRS